MQQIDEFLASLLADKGITDIEPDVKEELVKDMRERFMADVQKAAINKLDEEHALEFDKLSEDPSFTGEKVTEYLQNSGVNFTDVIAEVGIKFRAFYLGGLGE